MIIPKTLNNIKDTIERGINNIKIYCKENHAE